MVDKTEMSINHTVQNLPVFRYGKYYYMKIGTIIKKDIRDCAIECDIYNYDEFYWIGSQDMTFSDVEKLKHELEEYYIRIILIRLFNFDINNGTIEDILKNKEFISLQLTEEEQQYWLTTIVYIINKYRILQESDEYDLTYDESNYDDDDNYDDDYYDYDHNYDDNEDDNEDDDNDDDDDNY